jgi:replicative DNA helicase
MSEVKIETSILANLLINEKYSRVVIPFLKDTYFSDKAESQILKLSLEFFNKHNRATTPEILSLELKNVKGLSDAELETAQLLVNSFSTTPTDIDWLLTATETFCKKRAIYLAIMESIGIMDGSSKLTDDAIPKLLADAININFDSSVGHAYLADASDRFDQYNLVEDKISFGITALDKLTKGGMSRKTLNSVGGSSGAGKSIFMTNNAAVALAAGKNVLYITMEMSEIRISERIDANLMNITVDSIKGLPKDVFMSKIDKISSKTHGKLYVKEYPTGAAHSGHFRGLLEELKTKQNFIPNLIIIDYLGICASARIKMGGSTNTNTYVKTIAEELRSLAIEFNVPILTGHQLNRGAYDNSDVSMADTADSIGLIMSLDSAFTLIATDELSEMDQIIIKMLKNRYGELDKFVVGLEKAKMKFYELEASAQTLAKPALAPQPSNAPQRLGKAAAEKFSGFKM